MNTHAAGARFDAVAVLEEPDGRLVVEHVEDAWRRPGTRLPGIVLPRYNQGMKTAISLPDEIFEAADVLAERMGLSRSELYARAVEEFLARHRDQDVTEKLNQVYAEEPSGLPPALRKAQARSVSSAEW